MKIQQDLTSFERSLLEVEDEIFWTIIAKKLASYLLANECIKMGIRKEGILACSVFLEYTSAITHLINKVKRNDPLSIIMILPKHN